MKRFLLLALLACATDPGPANIQGTWVATADWPARIELTITQADEVVGGTCIADTWTGRHHCTLTGTVRGYVVTLAPCFEPCQAGAENPLDVRGTLTGDELLLSWQHDPLLFTRAAP